MDLVVRRLGRVDHAATCAQMRAYTEARSAASADELWLCEHAPIYTLGLAGKAEHVLDARGIPVVQTNRGGQVTYHGPGQVVAYPLLDLKRLGIYVKEYVYRLEQALIRTLEVYGVTGHRVAGAPGVYVRIDDPFGHAPIDPRSPAERDAARSNAPSFDGLAKIGALGIKVSRNCTYHGVALNVAMDLRPFAGIEPCGYAGLATVDLSTIGVEVPAGDVAETLAAKLGAYLGA
ncbi:MAG: lipoyl(octanoyl) transferase LipB [Caldimonas sp.]